MNNVSPSEMDSDRWHKIEALYNSALGLDANERAAWLSQACAGDESIRLDVLSLLESADTEDSFLEEPALSFGLTVLGLEDESLIGASVDRYKILKKLGRGGMGEVYLAQDPRLNRWVALKLLPASITDDRERVRRFEQEARAASAIAHPNVAHIYEIGEAEGRHYITMEYIKGPTLRHLLRKKSLDPDKAVEIAIQVATALSAAHGAGVIHRDIKPENIIMAVDGYVKVLDFGLAKLIESPGPGLDLESQLVSSLHTGPELFMGTSHYMSPEQVRRQPVDLRTDLWSLGVVTYEMLTFRRPFQGQSFSEVIVAIIEKEPELLGSERSSLSSSMRAFLSKALKKGPDDRYQTADEALRDLRQIQPDGAQTLRPGASSGLGQTTDAQVPPNTARADKEPTTTAADPIRPQTLSERIDTVTDNGIARRSIFSLVSRRLQLTLAGLLVISAGAYYGLVRKHPGTLVSRTINLRFERLNLSGNISDIVLSPDGKYVASVVSEDGKDTIHIMELATLTDLVIVPRSGKEYSGLSFSPDGNYVYYLEDQAETGTLYRVSKLGGGQRKILTNVNTAVTFSPDGRRLAFARHNLSEETPDIVTSQADGTSETTLARRGHADLDAFLVDLKGAGPAWSPDGKLLACPTMRLSPNSQEMNVEVLDAATGTGRRLNVQPWYDVSRITWLADASGLVLAAKESVDTPWQLELLSYPSGEVRHVTKDPNNYNRITGTSDSSLFVTINVEENSNISLLSSGNAGRFSQTIVNKGKGISETVWESEGGLIYTVYDGKNANLWRQDPAGKSTRQLTFEADDNYNPTVTPDQRYIVFVSTRLGGPNIWRMDADGTHVRQLTTGVHEDMPSITSDSKWVIYRTAKGVRKVSIEGGNTINLFDRTALYPTTSPDGRLLAYFTPAPPEGKIWRLEVLDARTLGFTKNFLLSESVNPYNGLRWMPGGESLTYISSDNGAQNLWQQSLNGGAAKRLTDFQDAEITSFAWSSSGRKLVCVRHSKTFVPVLVRIF